MGGGSSPGSKALGNVGNVGNAFGYVRYVGNVSSPTPIHSNEKKEFDKLFIQTQISRGVGVGVDSLVLLQMHIRLCQIHI